MQEQAGGKPVKKPSVRKSTGAKKATVVKKPNGRKYKRGGSEQESQEQFEAQADQEQSTTQQGGKRKLTAYTAFVKKEMPKLIKAHPNKKVVELMKEIGKLWRAHKK